jgi:hypothetical protein
MKMLQHLLKFLKIQNGLFDIWTPCRKRNNVD